MPDTPQETPTLLTFRQFAAKHPAFTESSLRWLRFRTTVSRVTRKDQDTDTKHVSVLEPNGFAGAFVEVQRRVLIDETAFFRVVRAQNEPRSAAT